MSDFLSREDVAAVPERKSVNTGFEWEGPKQSVAFSETQMPPASEPSPSRDFGASSISSEEEKDEEEEEEEKEKEEAAPSLPEGQEDPSCAEGLCAAVEKQAADSELPELEPAAVPAAPPPQPWGREEVAEDGEDNFVGEPLRKLNGERPDSSVNNGLPAVIRCFQVVSPDACSLPNLPVWLWAGTPNKHCSKQMPRTHKEEFRLLGLFLGANYPVNLLQSLHTSPSQFIFA